MVFVMIQFVDNWFISIINHMLAPFILNHLKHFKFCEKLLINVGFLFLKYSMASLDLGKYLLAFGLWINGFDYQNKEKDLLIVTK